jgi:hypothetical protein
MPHSLQENIMGGLLDQTFRDAFAMPALLHPEETWKRYGGGTYPRRRAEGDDPVDNRADGRREMIISIILGRRGGV